MEKKTLDKLGKHSHACNPTHHPSTIKVRDTQIYLIYTKYKCFIIFALNNCVFYIYNRFSLTEKSSSLH